MKEAVELAEAVRDMGYMPEQVQDFYPTPSTMSTCMYYTGVDPRTMQPIYVPRDPHEKAMQRALIQYRKPENWRLVQRGPAQGRPHRPHWLWREVPDPPLSTQGERRARPRPPRQEAHFSTVAGAQLAAALALQRRPRSDGARNADLGMHPRTPSSVFLVKWQEIPTWVSGREHPSRHLRQAGIGRKTSRQ